MLVSILVNCIDNLGILIKVEEKEQEPMPFIYNRGMLISKSL